MIPGTSNQHYKQIKDNIQQHPSFFPFDKHFCYIDICDFDVPTEFDD